MHYYGPNRSNANGNSDVIG